MDVLHSCLTDTCNTQSTLPSADHALDCPLMYLLDGTLEDLAPNLGVQGRQDVVHHADIRVTAGVSEGQKG